LKKKFLWRKKSSKTSYFSGTGGTGSMIDGQFNSICMISELCNGGPVLEVPKRKSHISHKFPKFPSEIHAMHKNQK